MTPRRADYPSLGCSAPRCVWTIGRCLAAPPLQALVWPRTVPSSDAKKVMLGEGSFSEHDLLGVGLPVLLLLQFHRQPPTVEELLSYLGSPPFWGWGVHLSTSWGAGGGGPTAVGERNTRLPLCRAGGTQSPVWVDVAPMATRPIRACETGHQKAAENTW